MPQDRARSNGMDILDDPSLIWLELSGARSKRSVTRSFPRPGAASNCPAPDGGSCICRVNGARCHACALHHGSEYGAVTLYGALVRLRPRRTCVYSLAIGTRS